MSFKKYTVETHTPVVLEQKEQPVVEPEPVKNELPPEKRPY